MTQRHVGDEPLSVALLRVTFGICGVAGLMIAFRILAALLPAAQIPGLTWPRALAVAGTFAMMGGALVLIRKAVTGRGRSLDLVRRRVRRQRLPVGRRAGRSDGTAGDARLGGARHDRGLTG